MAENAFSSVEKGQPVVVHGRLHVTSYEKEGQPRTAVEIEARALGHDLSWGVSTFVKAAPRTSVDRQVLSEIASELDDDELDDEIADPVERGGDGDNAKDAA